MSAKSSSFQPASGFRRLNKVEADVEVFVNGRSLRATPHDTVASLLLAYGMIVFRSNPATSSPRGPYCMMGVCFECLVTVDGMPDTQACMTQVRVGMHIETQIVPKAHGAKA